MITVADFKNEAIDFLDCLSEYGFHRHWELENETTTYCKLVYVGVNVAFEFFFDVRTQLFTSKVGEVDEKFLAGNPDILPCELYSCLVHFAAYRGKPNGAIFDFTSSEPSRIQEAMRDWFCFVESHASFLLKDEEGFFSNG